MTQTLQLPFRQRLLTPSSSGDGTLARLINRQTAQVARIYARPASLKSAREQQAAQILSRAVEAMYALPPGVVKALAMRILPQLRTCLLAHDITGLPQMSAWRAEDGAFVVECGLSDRRLGLSFDVLPEDSGWFFASLDSSEQAFAPFADGSLPTAVAKLLKR